MGIRQGAACIVTYRTKRLGSQDVMALAKTFELNDKDLQIA
jgi:hypothetical protein